VSSSRPAFGAVKIVRALPEDAGELSSIAHAAKAHWGYPGTWLRRWGDVLTLTPSYLNAHPTFAIASEGRIIGFFALVMREKEAFLDHLWVLPSEKGKGAGRLLFEAAENLANTSGATSLKVESDPHAEGFYLRMGAVRHGQVPASMDGTERFLPLLEKAL
jgi:GNAT superfamily N-acetyltransferase